MSEQSEEQRKAKFYGALLDGIMKDAVEVGRQIAKELEEGGEATTLDREASLQLFAAEWLHARSPWLRACA